MREVIDLAQRAGIGIYPETKHPAYFRSIGLPLEETMVEALHAAGYGGKSGGRSAPVFLQSFEVGNLRRLRQMTDLRLVQLLEEEGKPWDSELSYRDMAAPEGLREIATYADGIGPGKRLIVPAGPEGELLPPTALVEDAHFAGLLVHPWAFRSDPPFLAAEYEGDPGREYEQFLALGVDGFFSDFPDICRYWRDGRDRRDRRA